jgi:hypothetical protein
MHKSTIIKPVEILLAYGASVQTISNSFPYVSKRRVKKISKSLRLMRNETHSIVGKRADLIGFDMAKGTDETVTGRLYNPQSEMYKRFTNEELTRSKSKWREAIRKYDEEQAK